MDLVFGTTPWEKAFHYADSVGIRIFVVYRDRPEMGEFLNHLDVTGYIDSVIEDRGLEREAFHYVFPPSVSTKSDRHVFCLKMNLVKQQ